jgi:NTP pyrophosphatase (non-canonical NTP hydrolase)
VDTEQYRDEVFRTSPPMSGKEETLQFCALGLTAESGEFADFIKKWLYHGHELDESKLLLELGDILWYANRAAFALGLTLEDVMQANSDKLRKRYPDGFSTQASLLRRDVQ